ncbi:hypothetical protein A2U01_0059900, partial [Trifolium medium]|nr:hypothetical protein [Trifolium medium]
MIDCVTDSLRVNPVHVTSKKEGLKKPPKRSIKKKRIKWNAKEKNPKNDPASVKSLLVDRTVAPLKKVTKRSQ